MSGQTLKIVIIVLSLAIGMAQGAYLLHLFHRYGQASENAMTFESRRAEIARLDEVLSMSARLYAATGDWLWYDRYMGHVEPLDRMLGEVLAFAADEEAERAIDQVSGSNASLIALEERSLELALEGRLTEALALVTSPEYAEHKDSYQDGLKRALEISHALMTAKVDGSRREVLLAAFLLVASLLLLSELWRRLSVSEQRHAAEQIKASLDREQQLGSLQRQFVSILSHELRTPLAIIDGKAHRLETRAGELAENQIRSCGEAIRDAARQLTGLMEGVLNVSRIEEGRIDINREMFDPAALIEKVVAGHREVDSARRIDLALADLPAAAYGDPRLLTQVVSNLVSNALKYSDRCAPVRVEGCLDGDHMVIAVHDEGVGIPKEEIDRLGERFFRASSSAGISGTGIGLHFTRHLIDLHNGRLEVKSSEGIGSSFTVYLPQRSAEQAASARVRPDVATPELVSA